jgi:hypothetical protein
MYHDEGHIPIKLLAFKSGVNVTIGLPIIRTSVDHGTAFDIAGKGIADEMSMQASRSCEEASLTEMRGYIIASYYYGVANVYVSSRKIAGTILRK